MKSFAEEYFSLKIKTMLIGIGITIGVFIILLLFFIILDLLHLRLITLPDGSLSIKPL